MAQPVAFSPDCGDVRHHVLQLLLLRVLAVIWQQNTLSRELFDTRRTLTLGLMGPPSTKGRSRR